mgnify:CR=1 FL=1|tara:strand:+ start:691 stop:969 length:279 start_codon:yes stop_codon:yes gene_type:complete
MPLKEREVIMLDTSILQTKTANKLIGLLKLARTITKSGSNYCNGINDKIEKTVIEHERAMRKVEQRSGRKPVTSYNDKVEKSNYNYNNGVIE